MDGPSPTALSTNPDADRARVGAALHAFGVLLAEVAREQRNPIKLGPAMRQCSILLTFVHHALVNLLRHHRRAGAQRDVVMATRPAQRALLSPPKAWAAP